MKYFLLTIFFYSASLIYSQNFNFGKNKYGFRFEHYSIEQGLSQSNVRCILQGKNGFLWLGTQDGLNRFDGYDFLVFKNIIGDSNSLSHNYIYDLAEDKDGNIWIATGGGGICRYNPYNNSFKTYERDVYSNKLFTILSIYVDSKNQVWAGSYLIGLSKYNPDEDTFISYVYDENNQNSIPSNTIVTIYEDSEKNLWLGSDNAGLIKFEVKHSKFTSFKQKNGLPSNYVTSICEDKGGNLVVGTVAGLSIFDKQDKFTNHYYSPKNSGSLSSNKIKTVFSDNAGNLFVGTEDAGINFLPQGESNFYKYRAEDKDPFAVSDNIIHSFYEDQSGIIWIATGRGLNKIKYTKKFLSILGEKTSESGSGENVWAVFEDSKKNLWAGTDRGLFLLDKKNNEQNNSFRKVYSNETANKKVFVITEDGNGNIWLGTSNGLLQLDVKTNSISTYRYLKRTDDFYHYNVIKSILADGDTLWLGTSARGLIKFNIQTKKFFIFQPAKGNFEWLSKYTVYKTYKDKKGDYWFCTTFGLLQYIPQFDSLVFAISSIDEKTQEFSKIYNQSMCLYEDERYTWIGTAGGGLVKYNLANKKIERFLEQDGLPNNIVYGILPDEYGNLWISTNEGIAKFNITESSFKNYDFADGLPSNEFNAGAYLKSSSGKLYFGSINGIVSFYPEEIKGNNFIPQLAITDFKVFDESYHHNKKFYTGNETIKLSYSDNFFSFEFTSLDFTNTEKNQYAYKLEGLDAEWNYTGYRRYASYTNIEPGEYTFRVIGTNNDGIWNEKGASIKIIISPPFYRTWWAYSIYIAVILSLLYLLRMYELNKRRRREELILKDEREKAKLREAQLRAEKAELQAKALETEKEIEKQNIRTRIAADLHDEIGSNLSSIGLLSSLLMKKQNDKLENHVENGEPLSKLSDINMAAKSSAQSIRDIVWFTNPMTDRLSSLITKLKETTHMMLGDLNFKISGDDISIEEKVNPKIKRNIYLIYKEILNNIIKHAKAEQVIISIKKNNNNLLLSVEDDGTGFDTDKIIFGNGLKNLKSRAEQIKGDLIVSSVPGKGTQISLKVKI